MTRTSASSSRDRKEVTSRRSVSLLNISCAACRSSGIRGQNLFPNGIIGLTPSIRSSARCFHDLPAAARMTRRTTAGMLSSASTGSPSTCGAKAASYPCIIRSTMWGRRDAWKVGTTGGRCERESKANEVMGWVAYDCLVKVANLNRQTAGHVGNRSKVARMAVAAYPDGRPLRQRQPCGFLKPLIEANGTAAHIGMRGGSHLPALLRCERLSAIPGLHSVELFHTATDHNRR